LLKVDARHQVLPVVLIVTQDVRGCKNFVAQIGARFSIERTTIEERCEVAMVQ